MKLKQWLYGATALAMLAACSERDLVPETGGGSSQEGSGFVGVRIQLPTVPSTRANDSFNDGEPSEYKLDDAVLVLFQGSDERNATCIGSFELRKSQLNADMDKDHNQITTQVTRVATVTGVDLSGSSLYALVIANGSANKLYPDKNTDTEEENTGAGYDFTKIKAKATKENGVMTEAAAGGVSIIGKNIQWFQEAIISGSLYSQAKPGEEYASNILMTNSPLTTVQGGNTPVGVISNPLPVLVQLNTKVWPTEAEALANPAGTIHIERAVGKITCSSFNKETGLEVTVDGTKYQLVVDQIKWGMAQDMSTSYFVRNTNRTPVLAEQGSADLWKWNYASDYCVLGDETGNAGPGKYRMIGHTPIISTLYRPYFCQVPGYSVKKDDNYENKTFINTIIEVDKAVDWSDEAAFYPRENTFPVDYMKYANTTRIGFWVNFKFKKKDSKDDEYLDITDGANFYTKGLDKSTIYFDNNGYDPLTSQVIETLTADTNLKEKVEEAMDQESLKKYEDLDLGDLLDIDYKNTTDGEIIISNISFLPFDNPIYTTGKYKEWFIKAPTYTFSPTLINELNNLDRVYKYTGGWTFYEVRIKHFGEDLTPWDGDALTEASTIAESYGDESSRSKNYLGRYGIVRNNWYDLNVQSITKLGDPQDPAKWDGSWPGKPDDNKDEYIAVVLRVLSWAKRTQSVKF